MEISNKNHEQLKINNYFMNKTTLKILMFGCMALALLSVSCSNDDDKPTVVATSLSLVSGAGQTAMAGTDLANPVEVVVKDQNGNALAGTTVHFTVGEGSVSSATATTGTTGTATVNWTLGATEGEQTLTVTAFRPDGTTPLTGSPVPVTATATERTLAIGDFHLGGVVFYLDGTGERGLVCAVSDLSIAEWGCHGTAINGADGRAIGTGSQNTIDIEAGCTTVGTAADLCAKLTLNGYSDWFLPSIEELNEINNNIAMIEVTAMANSGAAFANDGYWSSSEVNGGGTWAWIYNFNVGSGSSSKDFAYNVRAVRTF